MATRIGRSAHPPVAIGRHRLYPALLPIPIICFAGALITDIAYTRTADMMWLDFSAWLLLAGLIGGGFAGLTLIIDFVRAGQRRTRALTIHLLLALAAWIIEVFNSFIHARDGWTAVVPTGMTLSVIAVVCSLAAGLVWQSADRDGTGETR